MCHPAFNIFSSWYLWLFLWFFSGSFFFPFSEKKNSSQDAVFFFLCGRLCSQGLIKLPQHHRGDQWWSGMLSTAIAHLLYPQSSSTPPSISHSADTLLLIPLSSKKKNSTGGFPHAPITSPPLSFFLFHWLLLLNVFCRFLHSSHF